MCKGFMHICHRPVGASMNGFEEFFAFARSLYLLVTCHSILNELERFNLFLFNKGKKGRPMFIHSAVSSPLDRSKRFTLNYMADLFTPTPTQLLWEAR